MNLNPDTDLSLFITEDHDHDRLITDSRAVALLWGKRHDNVLRTIEAMRSSAEPEIVEFFALNFEGITYVDARNRVKPMYRMTKQGMAELTMSFTGDKSRLVRVRFINAFVAMAERKTLRAKTRKELEDDYERRARPSEIKGQIGSLLMNERKREKRPLDEERACLFDAKYPPLFLN